MIVADKLTKFYDAHAALTDVSLEAHEGEVVGLLGLNGAGKTTTLRILSGLLVPSSGDVTIDGISMSGQPEGARAKIAFLPETPPLYPELTVDEYLRFVARIHGVREKLEPAIDRALEATDLVDRRHDVIQTLSHGYKRRVGIAHVVVHQPPVILLDEPTSGLDPVQILHMRRLISYLKEDHTLIVSSHILTEVAEICDRLVVLHEGRMVAAGTEAELSSQLTKAERVKFTVSGKWSQVETAFAALNTHCPPNPSDAPECEFSFVVSLGQEQREHAAAALIHAGLGLRAMQPVDRGLESIFLQLAGGDTADA